MVSLAEAQFALLERCAALDPPPPLMGGYAEDALLARSVTRPHEDVDWLFPRRELGLRLAQAAELGFEAFETWGEAAPGEPFYLYGDQGSFGPLSEPQLASLAALRERFFPDRSEEELLPRIELLA
jgi:hypothetical protein